MEKLDTVMTILIQGNILHTRHKDHELCGEWRNYRDCHIEGDWVLVYELGQNPEGKETITFHATDNHANLFR